MRHTPPSLRDTPSKLRGGIKRVSTFRGRIKALQRSLIQFYSRKAVFKDFGAVGDKLNV
jgi:hypothetical protein